MKKILYKINSILFIVWTLADAYGQAQDLKAKTLLNQVNQKIESYNNIQIDFKYVLENEAENVRQETKGKLTIQDNKYVLEILGIQRIFDGETVFTISLEDQEVTISKENSENESSINPTALLNFFETGYNYEMDISHDKSGRKIQYVKLTPIDSESEIEYALLGIDVKTKHIHNLIEIGDNSTKTVLTVLNFKTNANLPNDLFNFDASKYANYYINNLD